MRISDWSSDVCSSDLLLPTSDSPASSSGSSKERPPACSRLTAWALRLVAPIAPVTTKRPPNSTSRCQSTEASISRGERRRLTSRGPDTSQVLCPREIGRATRRGRVGSDGYSQVVGGCIKKKKNKH